MNVLIVDDKEETLYLLETLLKNIECDVVSASNGVKALEKLRAGSFKLIVSDILMPEMDGFRLCMEVKKDNKLKDIPFVFYTATYTDEKDELIALKAGANKFIRKPVEPVEFTKIIQSVIREVKEGKIKGDRPVLEKEKEVFKLYNQRLVKKLEQKMLELKESEKKYHSLCENVNDWIFSTDQDGCITGVNSRVEMTGYSSGEIIGKRFTELLTPRSREVGINFFQRANKEAGTSDFFEVEMIKKDGKTLNVEISISSICKAKKFIGGFGIARNITKRRRDQERLRASLYSLAEAQRIAHLGNWEWNILKNELHFSDEAYRIFGLKAQEINGSYETFLNSVHPDDRETVKKAVNEALYENKPYNVDYRIVLPNGAERFIHAQAEVVFDQSGAPVRMFGTVQDITDLNKTQEALLDSATRLRNILDNAAESIITIDEQGIIKSFNLASERMFGYSMNEVAGKNVKMLMPEPYRSKHDSYLKRYLKDSESRTLNVVREVVGRRKNGTIFPLELYVSEVRLEKQLTFVGILIDITKRKLAEEQLRDSEARFRAIYESAPLGIVLSDSKGKILQANPVFRRMLGYSEDELQRMTFLDLTLAEDRQATLKNIVDLVDEKQDFFRLEKRYNLKDGSLMWADVIVSAVRDADGKFKYSFGIFKDITEKKRMETMLIQAEKMASIGQLAAGIAHEINNPIGFIDSNLNTLNRYGKKLTEYIHQVHDLLKTAVEDDDCDPEEFINEFNQLSQNIKLDHILENLKDAIAESLDGTARVKKIVSDLKDFSRTDKTEFESADINNVLEKTLSLVWNELKYKAEVVKEFGSLPQIECNPGRLTQVFVNLLVNAVQAIEQHGVIKIKTFQVRNSIKVQISDTGKGIPEDQLGKIFDAFFTTKEPGKGTGLGLSISYNIISEHRGIIAVESKKGVGTTFTVTLPLTKADEVVKLKVIVVDDDAMVRESLSKMVSQLYPFSSVAIAENGFDAGNLMNLYEPDLILLDITMPGISGLEMCKRIKDSTKHRKRKVVLITGRVNDDMQQQAYAAGADAFLRKPITAQELKQAIQKVMAGRL